MPLGSAVATSDYDELPVVAAPAATCGTSVEPAAACGSPIPAATGLLTPSAGFPCGSGSAAVRRSPMALKTATAVATRRCPWKCHHGLCPAMLLAGAPTVGLHA